MKRHSLFKVPGYRRLLISLILSSFGGQITLIALPLTAVILLQASPTQMGVLMAAELLPFAVLSLPSGVWLDRWPKLPVVIWGECVLGALVLTVPCAWFLGWLNMNWLYVVGLGTGCVYTVAGSASQIVMTQVAGRAHLVQAHAQTALSTSIAEIAGPASAGLLIKWLGAPLTLLVDAALLICSAGVLRGIRIQEPLRQPTGTHFWPQLVAGLKFVRQEPRLVQLAWMMGSWQFFTYMALSVQVIFAIRSLGLDEKTLALSYVALGLGSIVGGLSGPRLAKRMGIGNALLCGFVVAGCGWLLLALGPDALDAAWRFGFMLMAFSLGGTLLFIHFLAIRQAVTPTDLLGRMTSTMRWLTMLPAGPGALLGGWLGEHWGLSVPLWMAGTGVCVIALLAWTFSVLPSLRHLPHHTHT